MVSTMHPCTDCPCRASDSPFLSFLSGIFDVIRIANLTRTFISGRATAGDCGYYDAEPGNDVNFPIEADREDELTSLNL